MDCPWGGAYYPPGVWMLGEISKFLFAHELGHNFGVREEGPAWICGTSCRAENYASPYSVMGHGSGHFNAFEKWRFGWIAREGPTLVNGEYRIARIDRPSELPHALYIVSGADEYWIEYRPEVPWPVVHAGANDARSTPSRFPQRNLLLERARSGKFAVRNAFEVVMVGSDPAQATLRFRWTDRTRPTRPRIDAIVSGRWVTLQFPAIGCGQRRRPLRALDRPTLSRLDSYDRGRGWRALRPRSCPSSSPAARSSPRCRDGGRPSRQSQSRCRAFGARPVTEPALEIVPEPPPDEADLVERARKGDHGAYETLVRNHEQAAFRVAFAIVRSAADAEDVAQEAFVKAYRSLERFRTGAPFRPWLLRIVGNEARNARRASGRRAFHERRAGMLEPVRMTTGADDELLERDDRSRILAAVDALPEGERTAIVARYFIGLSDAEAAAALGVARATMKMRAWRGLRRLGPELEEKR